MRTRLENFYNFYFFSRNFFSFGFFRCEKINICKEP